MMLEFWKDATDKHKTIRELLTKLSKSHNCLCHGLLIAILRSYGLDISFWNLLQNHLNVEMYKVFKGTSPPIVIEISQFRETLLYQLGEQSGFQMPSVHNAFNCTKSIKSLRPVVFKNCIKLFCLSAV